MKKVGLIVNPVAGMGGSVGLKGTDGEAYEKALALGAQPVTPGRTRELLDRITRKEQLTLLIAPGKMGEDYVQAFDVPTTVVGAVGSETTAEDTRRIAAQMAEQGAELLIFVGGDGTARDIHDAIDQKVPVVAVPSGVKVYSAVFALSPRAAAEMVDAFVEGTPVTEEEVLDIDEEAFRDDRLASQLYGYLVVPKVRRFLQPGKIASNVTPSTREVKQDIAAYIIEEMDAETLYLLGPGTTVKAIADAMGVSKKLLGVDAVLAGELVGTDLNEAGILDLLARYEKPSVIIVTPIGGNGFIFGRGNKQFTPTVIKKVGRPSIQVVATRDKLSRLEALRVDSGDFELDQELAGYMEVVVGYREAMMVKVKC